MAKMKLLNVDELKEIELKLLKEFHEICISENINYSLAFGTLLGAVRHKGFIPWDDDIDVMMPRPDFNKFVDYCKSHETPFYFESCETNPNYHILFAKISSKDTVMFDDYMTYKNVNMGVYIDIFSVDGLGNVTYEEAIKRAKSTKILRKIYESAHCDKYHKSATRGIWVEPIRLSLFLLTRLIPIKWFTRVLYTKIKKYNFNDSTYVGEIEQGYINDFICEKSIFDEYVDLEFEGNMLKSISNYDYYLKTIYGDYMKLPPESERVSRHSFRAYKI